MTRRLFAFLMVSTIVLSCGWGDGVAQENTVADTEVRTAEEAYKQALEERRAVEPIEERLAITKKFLDEFPESSHTPNAISAIVYYQGTKLGDMEGAVAYAEAIRGKIEDPEIAKELDKEMIAVYGEAGINEKMLALADRLDAAGALGFPDRWNVIESAVKSEDWKVVREYCDKAMGMANAETFRADYPDYDFTEEELTEAANNRVGMLLVKDGWAQANLGQIDEALGDFAKADGLVRRSYVDIPEYDLNLYWGKTLLMKDDYQAAIDRFSGEGLVMRNEEALAGLKEAYVGIHKNESGFDAYTTTLHRSVAKTMDDFELSDYEGERHRFADLRSDVTLVAFWFPT